MADILTAALGGVAIGAGELTQGLLEAAVSAAQAEDGTKQVEPWELCYQERLAKFEKWLEDNRRRFDNCPAGDLLRLVAKGDGAGALAACEVEWAMLEANEDSLTTPTLAALFPSGLDQHALMRERLPVLVDGLEGAAAEAERARSEGRLPVDEPLQDSTEVAPRLRLAARVALINLRELLGLVTHLRASPVRIDDKLLLAATALTQSLRDVAWRVDPLGARGAFAGMYDEHVQLQVPHAKVDTLKDERELVREVVRDKLARLADVVEAAQRDDDELARRMAAIEGVLPTMRAWLVGATTAEDLQELYGHATRIMDCVHPEADRYPAYLYRSVFIPEPTPQEIEARMWESIAALTVADPLPTVPAAAAAPGGPRMAARPSAAAAAGGPPMAATAAAAQAPLAVAATTGGPRVRFDVKPAAAGTSGRAEVLTSSGVNANSGATVAAAAPAPGPRSSRKPPAASGATAPASRPRTRSGAAQPSQL